VLTTSISGVVQELVRAGAVGHVGSSQVDDQQAAFSVDGNGPLGPSRPNIPLGMLDVTSFSARVPFA
jgi:hypothetical protein